MRSSSRFPDRLRLAAFTRLLERDGETVGCVFAVRASPGDHQVRRLERDGGAASAFVSVDASPSDHRSTSLKALWRGVDGLTSSDAIHGQLGPDTVDGWLDGWWAKHSPKRVRKPSGGFGTYVRTIHSVATEPASREAESMHIHFLQVLAGSAREPTPEEVAWADEALALRREAFSRYLATLDPEAVSLCATVGDHVFEVGLVFDGLDPSFQPDAPLRRALGMRPLMLTTLANAWDRDRGAFRTALAGDALDALIAANVGKVWSGLLPILPEIDARLRALPPDVVGRLVARTLHVGVDTPIVTARVHADLPPSWRPREEAGWRAFADLQPAFDALHGYRSFPKVDPSCWAAALPCGGDWTRLEARLAHAAGVPPDRVDQALDDVKDLVFAFCSQVVEPGVWLSGEMTSSRRNASYLHHLARDLLFRGRSLPRALEVSRDWHAAQDRISGGIATLPGAPPASWPAGLPDAVCEGLRIVVLTDVASLVAEGARGPDRDGVPGLGHCVGGYGDRCRSGDLRVASLRRATSGGPFERLSTASLAVVDGDVCVVEHRGRGNAAPPPEATSALRRYVDDLALGTLAIDREALRPTPGTLAVEARAGYDWRAEGAWEAVLGLWGPVLPRPLRSMTPAGLGALTRGRSPGARHDAWLAKPVTFEPVTSESRGTTWLTP